MFIEGVHLVIPCDACDKYELGCCKDRVSCPTVSLTAWDAMIIIIRILHTTIVIVITKARVVYLLLLLLLHLLLLHLHLLSVAPIISSVPTITTQQLLRVGFCKKDLALIAPGKNAAPTLGQLYEKGFGEGKTIEPNEKTTQSLEPAHHDMNQDDSHI